MRTRLTLRPGERGTKKLLQRYGQRLVCVRYRYDAETGRRVKTVEIVVDEVEEAQDISPVPPSERRFIAVGVDEWDIRNRVKNAGGRWHPEKVAWSLPYGRIVSLGLTDRLIEEAVPVDNLGASEKSAHVDAL